MLLQLLYMGPCTRVSTACLGLIATLLVIQAQMLSSFASVDPDKLVADDVVKVSSR